jgi:hypothetical protein
MEKFIKVKNMVSRGSNEEVPNQFVINHDGVEWFQSYDKIIGKIEPTWLDEKIYLDEEYWDYSRITSKYRNQWLGLTSGMIRKEIAAGRIKLINLNP